MRPTVFNHQQYTDLEADYMILRAENEKLKAQLSTTNKRLEAAVEDLRRNRKYKCDCCHYANKQGQYIPCRDCQMYKTIWAIKQLEDLLDDRESFLVGKDTDEIYKDDIAALNVAIATLKEKLQYERLSHED